VGSVVVIVFLTAMTAYYITRIKTWWTSAIYYAFAFSMIAPFQMVMFPTVKVADMLGLATPWGMIVLYLASISMGIDLMKPANRKTDSPPPNPR